MTGMAIALVLAMTAPGGGVDCALSRLDPGRAAAIGDFVGDGEAAATPEKQARYDRDIDALADAAAACATEHGWTEEQAGAAAGWAVAALARPRAAEHLRRLGIEPTLVEIAISRLAPAERRQFLEDDEAATGATVAALFRQLDKEGVVVSDEGEQATMLGALASLLVSLDDAAASFAAR